MMSLSFSLLAIIIPLAFAGAVNVDLSTTADTVAGGPLAAGVGPLATAGGACNGAECFLKIVYQVWLWLKPLFTVIATFMIVRYGFTLINSQEEEKLKKAKQMIGASIATIMLLYLPEPLIRAFYGGYGAAGGTLVKTGAGGAGLAITTPVVSAGLVIDQLKGIIGWLETIVAVMAVTIIIVSGILAVTNYGKEEGGAQFKHTVGAVLFGVFLIVIKKVILDTFGLQEGLSPLTPAPTILPTLTKIVQIATGLLSFAGLIAAAIMIYAGILMALNFGNEEQYTKAKGIIVRTGIGLLAIGASLAVIRFVMTIR